jgi:tungstate transport system ATP-binding protein
MQSWVDLQQVSVHWRAVHALEKVSLTLSAGERVALIGSNGSGKSTLLRVVHGLIAPTQGRVEYAASLRQAMLFQRPHLLRMSALNNMALGLWLDRQQRLTWAQALKAAWVALARVGLQDVARHNGRTLSGGQLQRLALARAWARQPQLLVLDEPTASLDPYAKREVEALIHSFSQNRPDVGLLFASHNLGQVKRLASRVVYLEQGRLLADLPVAEFFDSERLRAVSPKAQSFVQGELP